MKRNLLTLVAASAIAFGGFLLVQATTWPWWSGCPGWHGQGFGLQHLTENLNLTPINRQRFSRFSTRQPQSPPFIRRRCRK